MQQLSPQPRPASVSPPPARGEPQAGVARRAAAGATQGGGWRHAGRSAGMLHERGLAAQSRKA